MADKKQDTGFTVTDRRLFTTDGDLRSDIPEEKRVEETKTEAPASSPAATAVATPEAAPADDALRAFG